MAFDYHPTGERTEIPDEFADLLADVYGRPPETVWEWWLMEAKRSDEAGEMTERDFYQETPTRHEVHADGDTGYTPCALDALAAAAMADGPTTVRSTDPVTDATVTVEVSDESVAVTPEDAVISIGRKPDPDVELASNESIIDLARETDSDAFVDDFCKYGNAFESEDTYADWAANTEATSFPASAEKTATLLHRLHRASRTTLVAGIATTFVADLAGWIGENLRERTRH